MATVTVLPGGPAALPALRVTPAVAVGVTVAAGVGVRVGVPVGTGVGVLVGVDDGVAVGVRVRVTVADAAAVLVTVGVSVGSATDTLPFCTSASSGALFSSATATSDRPSVIVVPTEAAGAMVKSNSMTGPLPPAMRAPPVLIRTTITEPSACSLASATSPVLRVVARAERGTSVNSFGVSVSRN